ncbi:MFS transporter [Halobacteriales archaeon QS_9_68_17]|nr:MAG: MFS transporter [Halobacteriales archaeon QS_9_68_17]
MVFLVNLARVVFAPLVEPLRAAFGFSGATVGLVVTMTWVGSALPRLPTGYLLTKVPRHTVVFGSGTLLAVAAAVTAVAGSFYALAGGALLMGLTSGAYFIAANPLVSELFPDRVGRAVGVHGMSSQLAAVGAPLVVGGVLLVADWRAVFFIVTGVAIIGATGFVWNGVFNFYVTYLVETKGLDEPMARNVLTGVFAAGVPAFVLTGSIAERVAYVPLMLAILAAFVASLLALTVVQGLTAVVVVSLFFGYVIHSLFPALDTYLLDSLPDENRASAYSLYSASMMLVQATGSAVLGGLTDAGIGFDAVFRGYSVALVAVLVVLLGLYAVERLPSEAAPA